MQLLRIIHLIYGTFTNGNTIHVCELSDLYKLNPGAESVVLYHSI
jgi:hypothetical protein